MPYGLVGGLFVTSATVVFFIEVFPVRMGGLAVLRCVCLFVFAVIYLACCLVVRAVWVYFENVAVGGCVRFVV